MYRVFKISIFTFVNLKFNEFFFVFEYVPGIIQES